MKKNQSGFGGLELIIVLAVIGVIVGVGWFVWQRQDTKSVSTVQNSSADIAKAAEYTDCHTETDEVNRTLSNGIEVYDWTTIEHTKVVLSDWNLTLTLPEELVGEAVCRYTSNGYEFSTKSVINDDTCVAYYRNDELLSEGVQLWQYPATTPAEGQINEATGTLEDYYNDNKAADGNYFTEPSASRNFYKIGNNFYVMFGDTKDSMDKYKASRTEACKNESPDFKQTFVEAMPSLKTN